MIRTTKLKNGVRIATMNIQSITASVGAFVGAGAIHETDAEYGLGHFLEHMAFKGTKTRKLEEIAEFIEMGGGYSNAYTSFSHTAYYANVLSSQINSTIEIIIDSVFNSVFPESEILTEKNVIKQEIKRSLDNPNSLCYYNLHEAIYKETPLGRNIIGTEESVDSFVKNDFQNFVNKWYTPENLIIVCTGSVDHDLFVKHIEALTVGYENKELKSEKISEFTPGYKLHKDKFEQTNIYMAFETVNAHNIFETQVVEMLSNYLSNGMGSPLFKEIREKRGLVYSLFSFNNSFLDSGFFSIAGGTTKDNIDEFIKCSMDEIEKVITNFDEKHLIRSKNQVKVGIGQQKESTMHMMKSIGSNWINGDKFLPDFDKILEMANNVQESDLKRVAEKVLNSKKGFSVVGPIKDSTVNLIETYV